METIRKAIGAGNQRQSAYSSARGSKSSHACESGRNENFAQRVSAMHASQQSCFVKMGFRPLGTPATSSLPFVYPEPGMKTQPSCSSVIRANQVVIRS